MGQALLAAEQTVLAHEHLLEADRQLTRLRKTPARIQLLRKLQGLLKRAEMTAGKAG